MLSQTSEGREIFGELVVQRSLWPDDEEDDEFITDDDRDAIEQLDPAIYRIDDMLDDTLDDLEQVADFVKLVGDVRPERDSKLTALAKLLQGDKELMGRKVLIFTEFSDTAKYLETHLRAKGLRNLERIDGSSSQKQRSAVIHRFSPFYNNASQPSLENEINILIATDVLAEGLNLQDANRLINFDLHWNPVRLMQRIGRVDRRLNPDFEKRLLAAHPELNGTRGTDISWNFLPPEELETLLRLYNRVNRKTLAIMRTFVQLRHLMDSNRDLAQKIGEMEGKYDGQFRIVFDAIRQLMTPPPAKPSRRTRPQGRGSGETQGRHHPPTPPVARRPAIRHLLCRVRPGQAARRRSAPHPQRPRHQETELRHPYLQITEFIGPSKLVTKPGWIDGTVWLDSGGKKAATTPGTSGFRGVPENVWNFHVGGYQVCGKWLKDRKGRVLTDDDVAHYHKIVIALTETIRLMAGIDQVIETHGGWPGAFTTQTKETKE